MISFLCLYPQINFAGGGGEPVEAPVYDELLNQISMREAEMLWQAGIPFYDVRSEEHTSELLKYGPRATSRALSSSTSATGKNFFPKTKTKRWCSTA